MFKLLALCGMLALLTPVVDASEMEELFLEFSAMRARITALEENNAVIKAETAALKAETASLKTKLSSTGELAFYVDGRTVCPSGSFESNATQGMMLVGRPKDGKTGATHNRPFDAGEIGRTPVHSHAVTVHDRGHTHSTVINDPGHAHVLPIYYEVSYVPVPAGTFSAGNTTYPKGYTQLSSNNSFTGITVANELAQSRIDVSMAENDAGEHQPLVYVLICQKII
jgi:hypothetical protein